MFRGLTLRETRLVAGLLAAAFAGLLLVNGMRRGSDAPAVEVEGKSIEHTAGQLVMDAPKDAPEAIASVSAGGVLDINTAEAGDFEGLPGIGPSKAAAIAQHRAELGGFASIDELLTVPGIGEKTLEKLRPFLRIDNARIDAQPTPVAVARPTPVPAIPTLAAPPPQPTGPVFVNRATQEDLERLRGIGPALAARILADRTLNGPFRNAEDLQRVKGIGPKTVEKNRGLMRFD